MSVDRSRVKALFFQATELPAAERRTWLESQTPQDSDLRRAVAELLAFHDDAPLISEGADPAPTDPLGLCGTQLEGRYGVEEFVAEGGFAFVFRALDGETGEPVAIKVFKEADPEQRERLERAFRREVQLLVELAADLPTLVQPIGLGRCAGPRGATLLFQALEWLEGTVLQVPVEGRSPAEVAAILDAPARALAAAHRLGVAHRDIKPANLFVQPDGAVRLLDFGIAKVASERARGFLSTATASSAFTVKYAAPEQVTNESTGPWTDVYALALVCVEQLLGRHPYDELGLIETMMAVSDPIRRPTPRARGVQVDDRVEELLASALSIDPARRPSMEEVVDGLATWR